MVTRMGRTNIQTDEQGKNIAQHSMMTKNKLTVFKILTGPAFKLNIPSCTCHTLSPKINACDSRSGGLPFQSFASVPT